MRHVSLPALILLMLLRVSRAEAQRWEPRDRWQFTAGGSALSLGDGDWAAGPMASVRVMLTYRLALDLHGAWLVSSNEPGSENFDGILGSVGTSFVWRGRRQTFFAGFGVSAVTLVEDDSFYPERRSRASSAGVYGAVGGSYWFGSKVGISGRATRQIWLGGLGFGTDLGIAFRL